MPSTTNRAASAAANLDELSATAAELDADDIDVEAPMPGRPQAGDDGFGDAPLDLGGVDTSLADFPILPKGVYPGAVKDSEYTISQEKRSPMIKVEYQFVNPADGTKVTVWDYMILDPKSDDGKSLARAKKRMLELRPDMPLSGFVPRRDAGTFKGIKVMGRLGIQVDEEYGNRNTLRGVALRPAGDDDLTSDDDL